MAGKKAAATNERFVRVTVQPRTSHCAAKSVRKHSGLDASSHGAWL
mgnify:CR=1 FL=1